MTNNESLAVSACPSARWNIDMNDSNHNKTETTVEDTDTGVSALHNLFLGLK
jgi:hypothetical protein